MRIAHIEAIAVDIPLEKNFGGSTYDVLKRSTVLTRLRTDDGIESLVYNGDNRAHGLEICRIITSELAPLVIGLDVFAYERAWERMFARAKPMRDRKLLMEAIACVDCAIWDAMGRATGKPVSALLGGYHGAVPLISIGGYYMEGKGPDGIRAEMEMYREAGMAGCKFKVGGLSPEEDAERVRVAREATGPDFLLAVDANCGWTAHDAIRFARLVERYDIAWFEEPCLWYDDAALMARVRQATSIPINAGQSEITSQGVRRLIDAGAVDLVNVDASECGGVTDWRRAAALCAASEIRMSHHEESQIAQHLIGAIPHGAYIECFGDPARDPIWHRMWTNRPALKDGKMAVSQEPGFGIELDPDMLARYRVN
ncbi:MAG: mandelate racemase/muconate lactonizing enzyme family protein [Hyphomicrobiaceae bacterium]|nr:mandelate racemase/muconate lactonizing enzyme family protein [Hyphomicrobiaceae bacterium]